MRERIYPVKECIPQFDEGDEKGKWFVIHSHIGSSFDKKLQRHIQGRRISGFENKSFLIHWICSLDSSVHEIVFGKQGGNQAENYVCRVQS